jgi:SAM-dependent methyltransferase
MLDVGCGNGAFLAQMRDYGWNVVGLDFDPNAVAAARTIGIEATCGALEMSTYPPESFDAVCLNHVIEHLYNPVETLHICRQILKPGGYLYVATPNIKSAGHARHQQFWRGLEPPRHLTLFSPDALTHAFELAGFNDLRLSAIPDSVKFYLQSTAIAQGKDPYTQMSIEPEIAQQLALEDKQCIDNPKLSNNIALIGRKA